MWENCKYWMQLYLTPCCSREIIILVHLQNPKLTSSGFRCLPNVLIKPSTLLNENEFLNFHNFHQTFSVFYAEQNSLLGKMSDDHLIFTWKVTWEGWPSDRIFIPWITLTIMSYSYHIHIDQQSINKWKYQEILIFQWKELLIMSRIVSSPFSSARKCEVLCLEVVFQELKGKNENNDVSKFTIK